MSRASAATSAATGIHVLSALGLLATKVTKPGAARRRRRGRAHDVGKRRLVAAVGRWLRRGVHGYSKILLRYGLLELILVVVR